MQPAACYSRDFLCATLQRLIGKFPQERDPSFGLENVISICCEHCCGYVLLPLFCWRDTCCRISHHLLDRRLFGVTERKQRELRNTKLLSTVFIYTVTDASAAKPAGLPLSRDTSGRRNACAANLRKDEGKLIESKCASLIPSDYACMMLNAGARAVWLSTARKYGLKAAVQELSLHPLPKTTDTAPRGRECS